MSLKWVFIFIGVAIGIYWVRRAPYAGMVASGWGGNAFAHLPRILDPGAIAGTRSTLAAVDYPGVPGAMGNYNPGGVP